MLKLDTAAAARTLNTTPEAAAAALDAVLARLALNPGAALGSAPFRKLVAACGVEVTGLTMRSVERLLSAAGLVVEVRIATPVNLLGTYRAVVAADAHLDGMQRADVQALGKARRAAARKA